MTQGVAVNPDATEKWCTGHKAMRPVSLFGLYGTFGSAPSTKKKLYRSKCRECEALDSASRRLPRAVRREMRNAPDEPQT